MLSLGLGLEKVADTRRKTAADLSLLLLFLLLLLAVVSQAIGRCDVSVTAYLLFLGGLGLRSRLTGRLGSRRLGGSSGLAVDRISFPADDAIDGNVLTSPSRAQRRCGLQW